MGRKWACDSCRRRKIQCDRTSLRASCDWCRHHNIPCTFDVARRGKSKALIRHRKCSPQPVWTPTGALHDQQPDATATALLPVSSDDAEHHDTPDSYHESPLLSDPMQSLVTLFTPSSRSTSGTLGQIHYGGQHLGQIDLENGLPRFSRKGRDWIFSKTGESISFQVPGDMPTTNASSCPPGFSVLPPQKTTLSILDAYLRSSFKLVFPIIDDLLFADTVTLAYSRPDGPATLEHLISKCCVLAFLSMTDLFRTAANEFPDVKTDACAHEARHILTSILEEPNITTLQSVLILLQYEAFTGRLSTAIVFHGLACRMITVLGGHIDVPIACDNPAGGSLKHRQRQHLRTLFWICYVFDKEITLRTSHPPSLTEPYCDLTSPNNDIINSADNVRNEAKPLKLHGDIGLSHLKGKASHLLYSIQASRQSNAELLRNIRELDAELEEWRLSLPPEERPSLLMSYASRSPNYKAQPPCTMRVILIHLEYFYLLIAIHHASGRCTIPISQNGYPEEFSPSVLKTSLAIALEASRSILIYLTATASHLAAETFWVIQFYPTVAITTLFLNILMNPCESRASFDLELLGKAAKIFRLMPVYQHTSRRHRQVQIFEGFVFELARLGHCAVWTRRVESAI